MKLYSEKLTQRVNELFHDLTKEDFQSSMSDRFEHEKERWEGVASRFFTFYNPVTVLDVGTGTGFVPLTIAEKLGADDVFICSDLSGGILDVAKRNLSERSFKCVFEYVKIESYVPYVLPFETGSMDVVTMNEVLHHVDDTTTFLKEVDRVLKPNSLLFIGHEPNKYFYDNLFLLINYHIVHFLVNPKYFFRRLLKKIRLESMIDQVYYSIYP